MDFKLLQVSCWSIPALATEKFTKHSHQAMGSHLILHFLLTISGGIKVFLAKFLCIVSIISNQNVVKDGTRLDLRQEKQITNGGLFTGTACKKQETANPPLVVSTDADTMCGN